MIENMAKIRYNVRKEKQWDVSNLSCLVQISFTANQSEINKYFSLKYSEFGL